jgi:hypothetical protein
MKKSLIYSFLFIITFFSFGTLIFSHTNTAEAVVRSSAKKQDPFSDLNFKARMKGKKDLSGDDAVNALGKDIDRVAKYNGMTGKDLKETLKKSKTLRISKDALLFYADELPSNASIGDGINSTNPSTSDIPDASTFFLHSRPSATAKIYINFKGGDINSAYWNGGIPFTVTPYSRDADPAFSAAELQYIKAHWLAVSEDFSPFDVDVTTEKPTTYDPLHYTQIYVTPSSQWYCGPTACAGGVAFVDSFTWGLDVPGFVFSTDLGNDVKLVSEAISHETGHTLGLQHTSLYDSACNYLNQYAPGYGTVLPGWAPIMGNSYYKGVTQWLDTSEWPYLAQPSGCTSEVNQIAVMTSVGHLNFVSDEAGSTPATAASLTKTLIGGQAIIDNRGITTQNDTDLYKIDALAGPINITVSPMKPPVPTNTLFMGNNDFVVRLLDSNLNILAESNPVGVAAATVSLANAAAGRYYLQISPSGYNLSLDSGGYPATGSMGQYVVGGSYTNDSNVDAVAPAVAVTAPSAGTTVAGVVNLTASATDNVAVTNVEFYRDGILLGSDNTAPYTLSWNTSTMTNGSSTLTAKAYDAAGNVATSSSVQVIVNNVIKDVIAPVVTISSPAYGAVITKLTTVTISASATDDSKSIVKMEILVNNKVVSTNTNLSSISYKFPTKSAVRGTNTIVVRAYDKTGNVGQANTMMTK